MLAMRRLPGILVLCLLLAGCGKQPVVKAYRAPQDPRWRMLAAIVPAAEQVWFFKAVGPSARLAMQRPALEAFLTGLKVSGSEVSWTLPAGWTEEKGRGERSATLRFGDGEPRLELSVSRLGGDGGGTLANVNRWRGQMGQGPLSEAELGGTTKVLKAGETAITLVDLEGPKRPAIPAMAGTMKADPHGQEDEREAVTIDKVRAMFKLDVPKGWIESKPSGNRIFEFQAGESNQAPVVTLTMLGEQPGGLGANINRWRQQAGLEPLSDEEAERSARGLRLFEGEGWWVEVTGRERSLVVAFTLGAPFSIFLKLDGRPDAVARVRDAFEIFARTARLNRRNG